MSECTSVYFNKTSTCFSYTVNHENLLLIEKSALINSISIYIDLHKDKYFPHYISTDEDKCELDPIFESFRKIDYLHLNRFKVKSAIKCLTEAKDLKLQINSLLLYPKTAEELEELTNPVFFVEGVNFIEFILDPSFAFTDIFYNVVSFVISSSLKPKINSILFEIKQRI